eukprot:TRINITY_DN94657_c0_g1_i1.p1 TRINITY_DN94657_c0_g1~~TRINITY_DN94657_c0_g1_i1.p1  ORF type:complete len:318 (-),score=59.35 TRINITY_DN94657_c0_g1_i1:223-1176(-)
MQAAQPNSLEPGKCEQCRKPLDAERFSLWYDFAKKRRSCEHLVCGNCRGMMGGWRRQHCPNSKCDKRFYAIQDALSPSTASYQDFFQFVNYTNTGRVTKEELAAWYTTNFNMTTDDVTSLIESNWQCWDIPKNHSFLKLGWFRSKDQGDLDIEEFRPVQEFMRESLARSLASSSVTSPVVSTVEASRGEKRVRSEADELVEGVVRNVAQKKQTQSEELQQKLRKLADKGREWFEHFDADKSGQLSQEELVNALLQTFMGSHQMTREKITSIVNGVWDAIDTDGGGSIDFDEFQVLRGALLAQLNHEQMAKVVSGIGQ